MATAAIEPDEALDESEADGAKDRDRLSKVHDRAIRRFDETTLPQLEMRDHSLLARKFIAIPGAQWDGDWGIQFENSIRVEIDKVSKGAEKIINDYRQNRIEPDFRPAGGDSDPETANTLDGIHRADSYHYNAQQARDNAFEEAVGGGFGAYRLLNVWADPSDKYSDKQRINPGMLIADADQRVFFDGNSKLYDKSDARFAFVLTAYTRDAFEEQYEDSPVSWPENRILSQHEWFAPDVVIVAEYYEVEEKDAKLLILTHKLSQEEQRYWDDEITASDLAELRKQGWASRTSSRKRKKVHKYLMSGAEVLKDQGYIAGSCIPIVPVYGKRAFVDNVERFRGYVSKRMDAQRLFNAGISSAAEVDSLAPFERPIFDPEQMQGNLPQQWAEANLNRSPFLLASALRDKDGNIVATGPIGKVSPPQLAPVKAALLQLSSSLLDDDADQAEEVKANVSADAMDIAAQRIDAKSGIYLDNMSLSVKREGEIYLEMAKEVYSEPGRVVETMSEEGDDGEAKLAQPFTDPTGRHMTINDFTSGRYKVVCTVTEATATRRDKTVRNCLNVATVATQLQAMDIGKVALLTAIMNMDGEGMTSFEKWGRKQLVQAGVEQPTDDEKQQMEQAAEQAQQQPPDPETLIAHAKAEDLAASAGLKQAKAGEVADKGHQLRADAVLKLAQAHAVGGPEEAPDVPDGLEQARTAADIGKTAAETEQIRTATQHLPAKLAIEAHNAATNRMKAANDGERRIRRGSEL
jgi:hypothetical protein